MPKFESVFASASPKLVVSFKALQGIKAPFQSPVFFLTLGARENFKFNNARCYNGVLFEQGINPVFDLNNRIFSERENPH